jgi:hypothetical protein
MNHDKKNIKVTLHKAPLYHQDTKAINFFFFFSVNILSPLDFIQKIKGVMKNFN